MRYSAEETTETPDQLRYRIMVPADSPLFAGHFPGKPILPGVAQIQILTEQLSRSLDRKVCCRRLEAVRFRKPVLPNTTVEIGVRLTDGQRRVEFEYRGPDGVITEGRLFLEEAP